MALIPPLWKIEGPFSGVDPTLIILGVGVTAGITLVVAIVAHQLAQIQPKPQKLSATPRATGEFDQWTERPKSAATKDDEYYALYGSKPVPGGGFVSSRAPAAPPPPLGEVVVNLGGPSVQEDAWVDAPAASAPPAPFPSAPRPPPAKLGPTDEVVAPSHSRRVRDTSTGMMTTDESAPLSFERSSAVPGALPPRLAPGDPFAPRAAPAPPPPPPPKPVMSSDDRPRVARELPEGTSLTASSKSAFRAPPQAGSVVGAGSAGIKEGETVGPGKKAIRCPKCSTVFAGPATRPATVKCPACGTSGTLK